MFGLFKSKNKENMENAKQKTLRKMCDELWESFYSKHENIVKELHKYEFLIESLYKTKNIDEIMEPYRLIRENYTNPELIRELGIFNKDEEERLIRWSNKYNELNNERIQGIEKYNKLSEEIKKQIDEET